MADVTPTFSEVEEPAHTTRNFNDIPQRHHVYPTSERAQRIVQESTTMDSLFSGVWPIQWSSPQAPEFHDVMQQCKHAGFTVLAACPSADSLDTSAQSVVKGVEFYLKKMREHPERDKLVRTAGDIDQAVAEEELGIFFTHQGSALFGGDLDRVGLWKELGFGSDWIPDIQFTAERLQTPLGELIFPDGGYTREMGRKGVPTPAPFQIIGALVDHLLDHGWSEEDCGKFLGGNLYRVFEQVW